jgi:myo-inositol-1(or 4)-monophosphatase
VEFRGRMILGGIFNPLLKEYFFAESGKGAYLNGRRIRVSGCGNLLDSLLVTGFPYDRQERAGFYLQFVKALMHKSQGIRRLGAAALDLAYVASGRFEAFWEFNLNPWDVAAGVLLVEEAGGRVTDFEGNPFQVSRPSQLLASNGLVHREVLSTIGKVLSSPLTK